MAEEEKHGMILLRLDQNEKEHSEITRAVKELTASIQGNGKQGLLTRIALQEQSLAKVWWWLGGSSLSVMAIAFFIIRKSLMQ